MNFSEISIQRVWEKGRVIEGFDPQEWREDSCGAFIHRAQYGNQESEFGWRIVAMHPDGDRELHPFHWQNDFDIANHRTHCHVTADRIDTAPTALLDQPRNRPA